MPSPLEAGDAETSAEGDASPEKELTGDPTGEGVPSKEAECPSVAVTEGALVDEAAAEAEGPLGVHEAPPVALAAPADSVGHTVGGNTLLVAEPVREGTTLTPALPLEGGVGGGLCEAPALPLGVSEGAPLPLPGGLSEGGPEAIAAALGSCVAVASALAAPLPLPRTVEESAGEPLAVPARDAVAAVLPLPPGEREGVKEVAPLLVAAFVCAPLTEGTAEMLAEPEGAGDGDPRALAEAETLETAEMKPLIDAAPLPLCALALTDSEDRMLPLPPPALPLGGELSVPCAGLPDGEVVPSGDAVAVCESGGEGVAASLEEGCLVAAAPAVALSCGDSEAPAVLLETRLLEGAALPLRGADAAPLTLASTDALPLPHAAPLTDAAADTVGAPDPAALAVADAVRAGEAVGAAEALLRRESDEDPLEEDDARGDCDARAEAEGLCVPVAERGAEALSDGEGDCEGMCEPLREAACDADAVPHLEPRGEPEGEGDAEPQRLLEREGRALAEARLLPEAGAVSEGGALAEFVPVSAGEAVSAAVAVSGALGVPSRGDRDACAVVEATFDALSEPPTPLSLGCSETAALAVGGAETLSASVGGNVEEALAHGESSADLLGAAEPVPAMLCDAVEVPLALTLAHGVEDGGPSLRVPPAVAVGAPPVPLKGGEGEGPALRERAPLPERPALLLSEGGAEGLPDSNEERLKTSERVAIEGEGAPLSEAQPDGAPLPLRAADAQPDGEDAGEALGDALGSPPLFVAMTLAVGISEGLAEAVEEWDADAKPEVVRVAGKGVCEAAGVCEALPLGDAAGEGVRSAVPPGDAVAQVEAPPLPLCDAVAHAQPVGDGDNDASAEGEGRAEGDPTSAVRDTEGEALCEAAEVLEGGAEEDGGWEAAVLSDAERVSVARPEAVAGAPLPLALPPLPDALPEAVPHRVAEEVKDIAADADALLLPVATAVSEAPADALPNVAEGERVFSPLALGLPQLLTEAQPEALAVPPPLREPADVTEARAGDTV